LVRAAVHRQDQRVQGIGDAAGRDRVTGRCAFTNAHPDRNAHSVSIGKCSTQRIFLAAVMSRLQPIAGTSTTVYAGRPAA